MSLQEKLDAIKANFSAQVPAEAKAIMSRSAEALLATNPTANVPGVGDQLPPFALKDSSGAMRHISEFTDDGPAVVSFFRGFW